MNQYTADGYTRISKARARRLYDAGAPVYLCPVKLRPGAPWHPETQIFQPRTQIAFDEITQAAAYYTCSPGAGKYLAYYTKDRNRHGGEVVPF